MQLLLSHYNYLSKHFHLFQTIISASNVHELSNDAFVETVVALLKTPSYETIADDALHLSKMYSSWRTEAALFSSLKTTAPQKCLDAAKPEPGIGE